MKLPLTAAEIALIERSAFHASQLLIAGNVTALVSHYGYALAFQRNAIQAVKEDLETELRDIQALTLKQLPPCSVVISKLEMNDSGLLASVECTLTAFPRGQILLELVCTRTEGELRITLEQLSGHVPTTNG